MNYSTDIDSVSGPGSLSQRNYSSLHVLCNVTGWISLELQRNVITFRKSMPHVDSRPLEIIVSRRFEK